MRVRSHLLAIGGKSAKRPLRECERGGGNIDNWGMATAAHLLAIPTMAFEHLNLFGGGGASVADGSAIAATGEGRLNHEGAGK